MSHEENINEDMIRLVKSLEERLQQIEETFSDYRTETQKKISQLFNNMHKIDLRTKEIEELAEKLKQIIESHRIQMDEFNNTIGELRLSIKELKRAKEIMEQTKESLNEKFSEVNGKLTYLNLNLEEIKKIPEKMENIKLTQTSMKTVTDNVSKVFWIIVIATFGLIGSKWGQTIIDFLEMVGQWISR